MDNQNLEELLSLIKTIFEDKSCECKRFYFYWLGSEYEIQQRDEDCISVMRFLPSVSTVGHYKNADEMVKSLRIFFKGPTIFDDGIVLKDNLYKIDDNIANMYLGDAEKSALREPLRKIREHYKL